MATTGALLLAGDVGVPRDMSAGVRFMRLAADRGQPDAQASLAFLHSTAIADRHGVEKNHGKALLYWSLAAETGSVLAETALGYRFRGGVGVPKSCTAAARYYRRVARVTATDPRFMPTVENFLASRPPLPTGLTNTPDLRFDDDEVDAAFATSADGDGGSQVGGESGTRGDEPSHDQQKAEQHEVPDTPEPSSDDTELIEYYRHSASHGNSEALAIMGGLNLYGGHGLEPNERLARQNLEAAAALGNGEAHGMLAHLALNRGANETAYNYFLSAANANARVGHFGLGMFHLYGIGVAESLAVAAKHFRRAADLRHADAAYHIGMMYWQGKGVAQNTDEAFRYFQIGAQDGQLQCRFTLGLIILDGKYPTPRPDCESGVSYLKAVSEAGEWNTLLGLAADEIDARRPFGALYRELQAASAGIEVAQFNAAMLLDKAVVSGGRAMPELVHWDRQRMVDEALALYELSGMQGHTDSVLRAGHLAYYHGGSGRNDIDGNGRIDATGIPRHLWSWFSSTDEGEGDFRRAAVSYDKASRMGCAESSVSLGWMYARGEGVAQNRRYAEHYFELSKKQSPDAILPASIALFGARVMWAAADWNAWLSSGYAVYTNVIEEESGVATNARKKRGQWLANSDLLVACGLGGLLTMTLYARRRRMILPEPVAPQYL
jgi:SEL1 protein